MAKYNLSHQAGNVGIWINKMRAVSFKKFWDWILICLRKDVHSGAVLLVILVSSASPHLLAMEMAFTCAACEGILMQTDWQHTVPASPRSLCYGADGRKHVAMHRGPRAAPGLEGGQEITVLLPKGLLVSEQS